MLDRVIGVERPAGHRSGFEMATQALERALEGVTQDHDVGIEKQDEVAAGNGERRIVGGGEAKVFGVLDQDGGRKAPVNHLYRRVTRGIVYNNAPQVETASIGVDRLEAFACDAFRVVGDDGDREFEMLTPFMKKKRRPPE